jgi:DNA-binding MarR family transcriptional regulator
MSTPTTSPPRFRLEPLELDAWRGLLRVHAALIKELDAELEREHGLALSSYEVLLHLEAASGRRLRMSELADSVLLSRSGLTRLVDRLEREGLIERATCPSDARGSFAVLTPEGRMALRRAAPTHLSGVRDRFLSQFSDAELRQLGAFWERVLPGLLAGADAGPACGGEVDDAAGAGEGA